MPSVGEPRDKCEERIKGYFFNRRTTVSRKKLLTRALPIGIKFESLTCSNSSAEHDGVDGRGPLPLELGILGVEGVGTVAVEVDLDELAGCLDADPHLAVVARAGTLALLG